MIKKIFYILFLVYSQSCFSQKQSNPYNGIWIPLDIPWEKFIQDRDSSYIGSFEILVVKNKEIAIISTTNITSIKQDSIKFNAEPGFFLKRGEIRQIESNYISIQYRISDERMVKLPETDTVIANKIYDDIILIENQTPILKYNNENYIKTSILYKESQNRVNSFLEDE